MITDEMIEAAAKAIRKSVTKDWRKKEYDTWQLISDDLKNRYRRDARMALEAALEVANHPLKPDASA